MSSSQEKRKPEPLSPQDRTGFAAEPSEAYVGRERVFIRVTSKSGNEAGSWWAPIEDSPAFTKNQGRVNERRWRSDEAVPTIWQDRAGKVAILRAREGQTLSGWTGAGAPQVHRYHDTAGGELNTVYRGGPTQYFFSKNEISQYGEVRVVEQGKDLKGELAQHGLAPRAQRLPGLVDEQKAPRRATDPRNIPDTAPKVAPRDGHHFAPVSGGKWEGGAQAVDGITTTRESAPKPEVQYKKTAAPKDAAAIERRREMQQQVRERSASTATAKEAKGGEPKLNGAKPESPARRLKQ